METAKTLKSPARDFRKGIITSAVLLAEVGSLMGLSVFERSRLPLETQNAYLLLILIPFSIVGGVLSGLVFRRPGAGAWAFAAIILGAFAGNMATAFVDPLRPRWSSYEWNAVLFGSLLASLIVATPAGAVGYVTGLVKPRDTPSTEVGVAALLFGLMLLSLGVVWLPVASQDLTFGDVVPLAVGLTFLESGLLLVVGFLMVRQWRARLPRGIPIDATIR